MSWEQGHSTMTHCILSRGTEEVQEGFNENANYGGVYMPRVIG